MITFLDECPNFFLSCLIQKVILFGSRSTSCIPAQNGSGALHATCLIALHAGACRALASHVLGGSSGARDEPLRTSAWEAIRILTVRVKGRMSLRNGMWHGLR